MENRPKKNNSGRFNAADKRKDDRKGDRRRFQKDKNNDRRSDKPRFFEPDKKEDSKIVKKKSFSRNADDKEKTGKPERSFKKHTKEDRSSRSDKKLWTKRSSSSEKSESRDFRKEKPDTKRYSKEEPEKRKSFSENKASESNKAEGQKKPFVLKKAKGENAGTDRLNKYIANSGICSRREADEYIKAGLVKVNGQVVTEMGVRVKPGDEVRFNDEIIKSEKKVYIILNKPKDYITTTEDPHAKRTVMELVEGACKERVYPVGRLDRNTTGVLLLTNDGDLAKKLTHPSYKKKKIYHVFLNNNVTKADMQKILDGIETEIGFVNADAVSYADAEDKSQVGIEIHSGQNHVVKHIFETLGYKVVKLDRVYFAGLTKKNLQRGEWRFLSEKEITMLRIGAYK